ncbi:AAA family ATPase [Archangium violaceum]|uniref:ATPase AAA n=1 Tax=Archangium violaceum Cb vi76 TaxID=1406225 RepID=A0A084SSJ4_9BACT|nr:AAA family ATPase [Archangium violaceum]KFA91429.1 ATPase AAA [Archangium violaceum Cb vi76]
MIHPPTPVPPQAAQAFRHFFQELREAYLERETLFTQIELALLCREHVLVVGPPGTAKSAIASAVLGRILDEKTGQPSLFAKQIAESTVQTDLIGPVDFKVLTETGRTEFITEDGMLGATHAFLDEVFDGRDMLLRSILNVLHERELKHGRRVTSGRIECAIMTSNRYLSEVLARSPELLLAFADRLSFISFVPKSFARRPSRAAMLHRFAHGIRPDLRASLTLQQLDVLQAAVEQVTVGSHLLEAIELLTDELERALTAQVSKLPDYVPTKYFSQRSVVKALWALKAAVVRDQLYRRPDRPLEATVEDLDALRWFFLLGGPQAEEVEALLKVAVDPRERAQLEIVRIEQKAFDAALAKVKAELGTGVDREAASLGAADELKAVEALARNFQPGIVTTTAQRLRAKLVPGPRHPDNRVALLGAARGLLSVVEQRMTRGPIEGAEARAGTAMFTALSETVELCHQVPELRQRLPALSDAVSRFLLQSLELIALNAESLAFDEAVKLDTLGGFTDNVSDELGRVGELLALLAEGSSSVVARLRAAEAEARGRAVVALRQRATNAYPGTRGRRDPLDALAADSRLLSQLEQALCKLDPAQRGLKQELLQPIGSAYARDVLTTTPFERIDQFSRTVQTVAENLRREGLAPEPVLAECREILEGRLREYVRNIGREVASPPPAPHAAVSGEAYNFYRGDFSTQIRDGEYASLLGLDGQLAFARPASATSFLSNEIRDAVARVELAFVQTRLKYLRSWLTQLLTELPAPKTVQRRPQADQIFDRLVKSRFPLLALKEGELVRIKGMLDVLIAVSGELGESARKLDNVRRGIDDDFTRFSKELLEMRASL